MLSIGWLANTVKRKITKHMNTKPLFVLISDGGDGSYYPRFTFNKDLIDKLEAAADEDRMDYESGVGMDGDGFHYETIYVPVECTAESLGISMMADDYADKFDA